MLDTYEKMGTQMKLQVITSFNQHYYDLIGRDCVESWLRHWPENLSLTCYVEEFSIPDYSRIRQIDFEELGQDYRNFQAAPDVKPRAKTFGKKGYCVIHAMQHSTADWVLWIDADVITGKAFPKDYWTNLLEPKYLTMYMGVNYTHDKTGRAGPWLVPETGIFAVNRRHSQFAVFQSEYQRRYQEHDFSDLRRSYDNDVFGAAVEFTSDAEHLDVCQNLKKPYKTPLSHTMLADYLHHYKAKHSKEHYQDRTDVQ
jgi:hypothetical protein